MAHGVSRGRWSVFLLAAVAVAATSRGVAGIDNGLGIVPARGWRSWNEFGDDINQATIEAQMAAMVSRKRTVGGVPTSLADLGFRDAGIDDGWQMCNSGPGGNGFHNASGYPIVNESRFPDLRAMTAKAHSIGLTAGWCECHRSFAHARACSVHVPGSCSYSALIRLLVGTRAFAPDGNNCICHDRQPACQYKPGPDGDLCFKGDVQATLDFGFRSVKFDGCGIQRNISHYAELFNASGVPVLLESCGNGMSPSDPFDPSRAFRDSSGTVHCPMNSFRLSDDLHGVWHSILLNLNSTIAFNGAGLTGPGCWGYPDMLQYDRQLD